MNVADTVNSIEDPWSILDIPFSHKVGGELNLAFWRPDFTLHNRQIKICQNNILAYILNPPIFLQCQLGTQPPNLIPANISGYTVIDWLLL